jgi:hypothetical protein
VTTREQALTVDCPECGKPAGEMCVMKNGRYVRGQSPYHYGRIDRSQVGIEAVRAHNGRNAAYFWYTLPPAIDVPDEEFGWEPALGPFSLSTDRRYRIKAELIDRPERVWKCSAQVREGSEWVTIGSFIGQYQIGQRTAYAQAKALCEADRKVQR